MYYSVDEAVLSIWMGHGWKMLGTTDRSEQISLHYIDAGDSDEMQACQLQYI